MLETLVLEVNMDGNLPSLEKKKLNDLYEKGFEFQSEVVVLWSTNGSHQRALKVKYTFYKKV